MIQETKAIRQALRKHGFTGSVRQGKGTAYCWIHIRGSNGYGEFTDQEREILKRFGETPGGNFCPIPPEDQPLLLARLEGREPDLKDVEHACQRHESRSWD